MTDKKNSLALLSSSESAPAEPALPVKREEVPPEVAAWYKLMLRVRKALLDPEKTPKEQRELLEMRAKLVIMGPDFLKRADGRKLRAMFDSRNF